MKKILLLFVCVFIAISCIKFEIINEIKPKVYIVDNSVGVEYMLGDILVSDELKDLSSGMLQYFKNNKDDITMRLHIHYNTEINNKCYFIYSIRGIVVAENANVVSPDLLMAKKDLISGFVMFGAGTSSKETPAPQKIKMIQEESKTEPKKDSQNKL